MLAPRPPHLSDSTPNTPPNLAPHLTGRMTHTQALLLLHLCAFLWGSAGIFGKLTSLPPATVTGGRTLIAFMCLLPLCLRGGAVFKRESWQQPGCVALTALFLAAHWWLFFFTLSCSTVALTLITFATAPVFASLLAPLVSTERLDQRALLASALVIGGVWIVNPITSLALSDLRGLGSGLLSAFMLACCSLSQRRCLENTPPLLLSLALNGLIAAALLPFSFAPLLQVTTNDIIALAGLGVLCSAVAQSAFIAGMTVIPARYAIVISMMEAPYGILLAFLILGEALTPSVITGTALVICACSLVSLRGKR